MQKNVCKLYPVRDYRSVENGKDNPIRMPLGMRTIKYTFAYLRHAAEWGNIFFYRDFIPNGIRHLQTCPSYAPLNLNEERKKDK